MRIRDAGEETREMDRKIAREGEGGTEERRKRERERERDTRAKCKDRRMSAE